MNENTSSTEIPCVNIVSSNQSEVRHLAPDDVRVGKALKKVPDTQTTQQIRCCITHSGNVDKTDIKVEFRRNKKQLAHQGHNINTFGTTFVDTMHHRFVVALQQYSITRQQGAPANTCRNNCQQFAETNGQRLLKLGQLPGIPESAELSASSNSTSVCRQIKFRSMSPNIIIKHRTMVPIGTKG